MNVLLKKFRDALFSVIPITIIVLILNFTIVPLGATSLIKFLIGAVLIIFGLFIFLIGIDIAIIPMGDMLGSTILETNSIWKIILICFLFGFSISVVEPVLHIVAGQIDYVTAGAISKSLIIISVSIGVGVLITLGIIRPMFNIPLRLCLTIIYSIIFILALIAPPEFISISFDAPGATTGVLTVPFISSLAIGLFSKRAGKESEEDSFGLVGITTSGAVIALLIMSIFVRNTDLSNTINHYTSNNIASSSIAGSFLKLIPSIMLETLSALLPIVIIFLVFQVISFKLSKNSFLNIIKGFVHTFIGAVLFLTGANGGFMDVGVTIGGTLTSFENKIVVILFGFLLGAVAILAEPSVYVISKQIEEVTSGYIKGSLIISAFSIGVGFAVALSVIRTIVPGFKLWYYLLPGYALAVILSYFVPNLFVGIAFDSGGVATGLMAATFILAFAQGAAGVVEGSNALVDGFGTISIIALMPVLTLLIFGLIFKVKSSKGGTQKNEQ